MSFQPNAMAGGSANGALSYVEFNTDVTVSATTEAAANTIVTAASFVASGTDFYVVRFYCSGVSVATVAGASVILSLFDNGSIATALFSTTGAIVAQWANPAAAAFITPGPFETPRLKLTAGAHILSIRGWQSGGNGSVRGSAGTLALPGFLKVLRDT